MVGGKKIKVLIVVTKAETQTTGLNSRCDGFYPHLDHYSKVFNPLNAELNPICYLLALLGAHHFLHVRE